MVGATATVRGRGTQSRTKRGPRAADRRKPAAKADLVTVPETVADLSEFQGACDTCWKDAAIQSLEHRQCKHNYIRQWLFYGAAQAMSGDQAAAEKVARFREYYFRAALTAAAKSRSPPSTEAHVVTVDDAPTETCNPVTIHQSTEVGFKEGCLPTSSPRTDLRRQALRNAFRSTASPAMTISGMSTDSGYSSCSSSMMEQDVIDLTTTEDPIVQDIIDLTNDDPQDCSDVPLLCIPELPSDPVNGDDGHMVNESSCPNSFFDESFGEAQYYSEEGDIQVFAELASHPYLCLWPRCSAMFTNCEELDTHQKASHFCSPDVTEVATPHELLHSRDQVAEDDGDVEFLGSFPRSDQGQNEAHEGATALLNLRNAAEISQWDTANSTQPRTPRKQTRSAVASHVASPATDSTPSPSPSADVWDSSEASDSPQSVPSPFSVTDEKSIGRCLSPLKRQLVDRIMEEFYLLFDDTEFGFRSHCPHGHPSSGESSSFNSSFGSAGGGGGNGGRKRGRGSDGESPFGNGRDDDGDGMPRKQPRTEFLTPSSPSRKFACPYFKRNPHLHRKYTSCAYPGFTTVARLKEHLYRRHALPIQCRRCCITFKTDAMLLEHERAAQACEVKEQPLAEGFGKEQERDLKSKKKAVVCQSEEAKWRSVYRILFPQEDEATYPSPYCDTEPAYEDTSRSPGSQDLSEFEAFSRTELPRLVRRELENAIEAASQPIEETLKSQLIDIVRNCQAQLFPSYQLRRCASATPIMANAALPTMKREESQQSFTSAPRGEPSIAALMMPPPPVQDLASVPSRLDTQAAQSNVADDGNYTPTHSSMPALTIEDMSSAGSSIMPSAPPQQYIQQVQPITTTTGVKSQSDEAFKVPAIDPFQAPLPTFDFSMARSDFGYSSYFNEDWSMLPDPPFDFNQLDDSSS